MTVERFLQILFPNGIGTRALLALLVGAGSVAALGWLAIADKSEAALTALVGFGNLVLVFYFKGRDDAAAQVAERAPEGGGNGNGSA